MANHLLKQHWRGVPAEEIRVRDDRPGGQPLNVEREIAKQLKSLEDGVLDSIIKRASGGELDAVAWLEVRGLICLPDKRQDEHS